MGRTKTKAGKILTNRREEQERSELGGYSAAEFDAEFVRTQRSDVLHAVIRLGTLALVYGLLARAIMQFQLSAAFLLLPMAFEWLLVMWLGLLLSRHFVSCPTFAKSANSPVLVVGWTLVLGLIMAAVLAWDSDAQALAISRIPDEARAALTTVLDTGLIWALLISALLLVFSTAAEVRRWRGVGGVFVWTSIIESGMRFAGLLVVGVFGGFIAILLADWLFSTPEHRVWTVFAFLLAVEVFAAVVGMLMHRDFVRKAHTMPAVKKRHARSPGFPQ